MPTPVAPSTGPPAGDWIGLIQGYIKDGGLVLGLTIAVLGMIVGLAIVVWLPFSLLLAWLLGAVTMGFGIAGVGVVATVVVLATLFQRIKRGRPEGYYQQWLRIRFHRLGLYRTPWVFAQWFLGYWENAVCSRYRLEIDNVGSHQRSLWVVMGFQGLVILALRFGWSQAPKQLRVHVPPDLRSGAVLAAEEVPPANAYAFAFYIFQQLNRWSKNGATDYGKAIFRMSASLGSIDHGARGSQTSFIKSTKA